MDNVRISDAAYETAKQQICLVIHSEYCQLSIVSRSFCVQYCVVDRELGQLMVQEQSLQEPRELEDLQLCGVKTGTPDFIDRNFCFRVISPTSEHLFQALTESEMMLWIAAIQEGIAEAIKRTDLTVR